MTTSTNPDDWWEDSDYESDSNASLTHEDAAAALREIQETQPDVFVPSTSVVYEKEETNSPPIAPTLPIPPPIPNTVKEQHIDINMTRIPPPIAPPFEIEIPNGAEEEYVSLDSSIAELRELNTALQRRVGDIMALAKEKQRSVERDRTEREKELAAPVRAANKPKPLSKPLLRRIKQILLAESEAIEAATQSVLGETELKALVSRNEASAVLTVLIDRINQLQGDISTILDNFGDGIISCNEGENLTAALQRVRGVADYVSSMKKETNTMRMRGREERWCQTLTRNHHMEIVKTPRDGSCMYITAWLNIVATELLKQPNATKEGVLERIKQFDKKECHAGGKVMRHKMAEYMKTNHSMFKDAISASLVEAQTGIDQTRTGTLLREGLMNAFIGKSEDDILESVRLCQPDAFDVYLNVMSLSTVFGERTEAKALSGALQRPLHLYYMPFGWGQEIDCAMDSEKVARMPKLEESSYGFTPSKQSRAPQSSDSPSDIPPPPSSRPPPSPMTSPRDGVPRNNSSSSCVETVPLAPTEVISVAGVSNESPILMHHLIASNHYQMLYR